MLSVAGQQTDESEPSISTVLVFVNSHVSALESMLSIKVVFSITATRSPCKLDYIIHQADADFDQMKE